MAPLVACARGKEKSRKEPEAIDPDCAPHWCPSSLLNPVFAPWERPTAPEIPRAGDLAPARPRPSLRGWIRSAAGSVSFERVRELSQHLVEPGVGGIDDRIGIFVLAPAPSVHSWRQAYEFRVVELSLPIRRPKLVAAVAPLEPAKNDLPPGLRSPFETELDLDARDGELVGPAAAGVGEAGALRPVGDGGAETARRIDQELEPVYELLKVQTNPSAIKAVLNLLGHDVGGLRLPLVQASEGEVARLRDCLEQLGVLGAAAL